MRQSSVDGTNAWLILIHAHDHVWRDLSAAQLLIEKSIAVVDEFLLECEKARKAKA